LSDSVAGGLHAGSLVLCGGTLRTTPIPVQIAAAAAAGFDGISVYAAGVQAAVEGGLRETDLAAMLADHGLSVAEVDGHVGWLPGPALGATRPLEVDIAIAVALGARSLNVVEAAGNHVGIDVSVDAAAEAFAEVCDRAGDVGLLVTLEYYPWSGVPDSALASEIVRRADRSNGGLLLDTWHHVRGPDDSRLDLHDIAPMVLGVQVSDAAIVVGADVRDESMHHRLAPGEGSARSHAILQALRDNGCTAPIGVEIYSDEVHAMDPFDAAALAASALRRVVV
jgi:sugar phosphate isomerase/epimerase